MFNVPFKEKCIDFWSMDNTLKNEFENRESIHVVSGIITFNLTKKCFDYSGFDTILKLKPEIIKNHSMAICFQTRKIVPKDIRYPECDLIGFYKGDTPKLYLGFQKHNTFFCINDMKRNDCYSNTVLPIHVLQEDKWVTHVIMYDKNTNQVKYYIDAVLIGITNKDEFGLNIENVYFNRKYTCNGSIRNIGIFKDILTEKEVKKLQYHNYYGKMSTKLYRKIVHLMYRNKAIFPWE